MIRLFRYFIKQTVIGKYVFSQLFQYFLLRMMSD